MRYGTKAISFSTALLAAKATFYYSDLGDGGYNHLELRRYKRQYKQGANRKGDLAEPMRDTRDWLTGTELDF
jgi:hypothetical protein